VDRRLDLARELESQDAALSRRLERLGRLAREVERIRARAAELAALLERLPEVRTPVEAAAAAAEAALEGAREAHATAEAARERAQTDDARTTFERDLAAAEDAVRAAEARVERTRGQLVALAREAGEAQAEAAGLAAGAAAVASELEDEPRVALAPPAGADLGDVLDWAARAHAAILVVRSGLDVERERIFREANELGASVLGEPLQAANVAVVRRRVEERLGGEA
jgi:hypothetical protein